MKNADMSRIANDLIAAANIPEDISIRVFTGSGNRISMKTFVRHLVDYPYRSTKGGVTTIVTNPHYEYCERGFGSGSIWGILGEDAIRQRIADYIAKVVS